MPNESELHLEESKATLSEALWNSFFGGSRRACARLITQVENAPQLIPAIRDRLNDRIGRALRIGITGPPGVGKSTLTCLVAQGLANAEHHVGIVAVDPSSPFTGGAFMGDRVRMEALVGDERIYVRSLASREGHGGLSPATPYVADVIEGFGMDTILIETVGVGQAEIDVLECTDLVVLVLQPSTGDSIQTMKAGIIEAADIIVVNKSDLPGVDSVLQSLRFLFSLGGPRRGKPTPAILATSAQQSEGVEKVVDEIERQRQYLLQSGIHEQMRRARLEKEMLTAIRHHLWERYVSLSDEEPRIKREAESLSQTGKSPYAFIRDACKRIDMALQRKVEEDER